MQKLFDLLTFLGTGLLRGIDAFWALVSALTPGRWRESSRSVAETANTQAPDASACPADRHA